MATVYLLLDPESAQFLGTAFPQFVKTNGSAFPVSGLAYDAAADEAAFWRVDASLYASGNVLVDLHWYADTADAGDVVWGAALAAITPDTDSQDVETKALAAEVTATDTHLGTVIQRLHKATVTVTALDALAAGDAVWLRVRRIGANAADTMAGDAILSHVTVRYSDV